MSTPLKTRILIADDHLIVRRGLRAVLDAEPDMEVVAEAEDGLAAVELALREDVHLAVLDLSMPRMTGLQATEAIRRRAPHVRVLILSMHDNEQYLFQALRSGASGYVLKSGADLDLVDACRATMRGEPFLYPSGVAALVGRFLDEAGEDPDVRTDPLTGREREVLKLIAEAFTNEQIAELLAISPKTVERHRANILDKLGMHDRVELTRYAIRQGLVTP